MEKTLGHLQRQMQMRQQETQQFLERSQAPAQGINLVKMESGDDPEAFLMEFECAAEGAMWPKELWPMCLAPFLSREAQAIYQALPRTIAEDYDRLKHAILEHLGVSEESYRRKFRSITLKSSRRLHSVANHLQDWARRWLKPEVRSPEEIVELIVVEQLIQILPTEAKESLRHHQVKSLNRVLQLIEHFFAMSDIPPGSMETNSGVCPPAWEEATLPKVESRATMDYEEQNSGHHISKMEPQDSLLEPAKEDMSQDSEKERGPKKWIMSERKLKHQAGYMSTVYEKGVGRLVNPNRQKGPCTGRTSYTCTECGKSFSQSKYLAAHHKGEKLYTCNECGKIFKESKKLITHQRVHTGEKPFTCGDCGKGFSQVAHLISHKRMHTGEKPYTCNECGKHFGHLSTLLSHMLIHTGEKPYPCTVCGKSFRRSTDRLRHQRIHTGEKPYQCNECGKSFNQSGSLYTHQKMHIIQVVTI